MRKRDLDELAALSYSWKGPQWGRQTVRIPAPVTDQFKADDNGLYCAARYRWNIVCRPVQSHCSALDEASGIFTASVSRIGMWLVLFSSCALLSSHVPVSHAVGYTSWSDGGYTSFLSCS